MTRPLTCALVLGLSTCAPATAHAQTTITKSIATGNDDAEEEGPTGTTPNRMWLTSSDIELVSDFDAPTAGVQKVGLRFTALAIPVGAVITDAYLTFRAVAADPGMSNSDPTSLTIKAQLSANAPAFTTTASDISNRALTTASAAWVPATWITTTPTDYNSPSIASVIQEIVNQGTWAGGNAIAIIITGTGHRASQAYDTNAATAAKLTVTYAPITYYSKGSLAVSATSSWNSRRDGTGTDAAGFTGNDTFVVQSGHAMTLTGSTAWSVGAGGTVQIESGGTWTNTSSGAVTIGTLQVDDGGTYAHGTAAAFPGTTRTLGAASTVNWSGTTQTVAALSYGHLTISNSGTKTLGGAITPRGNLTVSGGTFDLGAFTANRATAGGTLTVGSGATLRIGGTNGFPSSYASETIDVASTVEYGGTSQAVRATSYGNLTLSGSGTKTFAASTTTLGGALTIGGGLTVDATTNGSTIDYRRTGAAQTVVAMNYFNLTVSGARAASSVTLASSGTIGIAGTFTPSATFTTGSWIVTGSTVQLNGSTGQAITGGFTFQNLTLANSSGVTLGASCTVNGVLTLTSGNVTTGAFALAIGASGSVSRTSGHVVGNLQKNAATGATSRTFEIGTGASYTPVTVAFANVSVAGNLVASTAAGDHASIATAAINPSRTVNRTWTLTNGGITFTTYGATFTFVAGDLDAGATTGNFAVGKYAASTWTYPTVGTRTATSTQVTGLTSFSDFQVGEPGVPSMTLVGSVAPNGTQPPGTDLTFTTTFTNVGTDAARAVVITRPVPANTDLKLGSVTQALGTTGLTVVVTYSSDGGSSWTYTPASGAGGAPAGYDRLATHVRWTFTGDLSQVAPDNSGSTGATVRIR